MCCSVFFFCFWWHLGRASVKKNMVFTMWNTHCSLQGKVMFCLISDFFWSSFGSLGAHLCVQMSSRERSWKVDVEARAGWVQGRNHFSFQCQKNLLNWLIQMIFFMFLGTLLTHIVHLGKKSSFVVIWVSFWRSLESLGTHFCAQCLLGSVLEK